jgi:3',5'-cyclic AMP phosphodiesterase CpdA
MTTLFAQISDPHIRRPGQLAYGRISTAPYLRVAVQSIMRLRQRPEAVVITGDLSDFGRAEEYEHLARLLAPLTMPVYLLPGNHDDRASLRRSFPAHAYLGNDEFIQYSFPIGELRVIALDTTVPGSPHGVLCARRLAWLASELDAHRDRSVIIAMHHPPFRTMLAAMDRQGLLEGGAQLESLVLRHPNVERIICGHLHRAIDVRFGGTIASTAPSAAHQLFLDLSPDAPAEWTLEPPGFKLHLWSGESRLVSYTVASGDYEGPYPFHRDGVLID